jgi:hypothetical protein
VPWLIDAHSGKGADQNDDADPSRAIGAHPGPPGHRITQLRSGFTHPVEVRLLSVEEFFRSQDGLSVGERDRDLMDKHHSTTRTAPALSFSSRTRPRNDSLPRRDQDEPEVLLLNRAADLR